MVFRSGRVDFWMGKKGFDDFRIASFGGEFEGFILFCGGIDSRV